MAFWQKVKSQFIDVIEWIDDSQNTITWKFSRHDNEIKNGAQLIVRESQVAVFLHEGELGDVFKPGRHELTTSNIPILTTLKSWKYAFNAPFKCDIYFVSTKQFVDLKWGTQNPIMLKDPEFGPVRLRAFGTYCVQINDAAKFIKQIAGTDSSFETDEIIGQFRNILVSRFSDALAEAKIPILDLAANYNEMGDMLREKLKLELNEYGVNLTKFLIENISLPQKVEEMLDKRSEMGIIGNMNKYTQFQTAEAIRDMAQNPGGSGNMMGVIAGMGMGNVVGNTMTNASNPIQSQTQPQTNEDAPPPLPSQTKWYAAINGQQKGPFDLNQLQKEVDTKNITTQTLVWKKGMKNWEPANSVSELSDCFNEGPPPLPK